MNRVRSAGEVQAMERLGIFACLAAEATRNISAAFTRLLTDAYTLCSKAKNSAWHMSAPASRSDICPIDSSIGLATLRTRSAIKSALRKIWAPCSSSRRRLQRTADYVTPPNSLAECWPSRMTIT